jgi:hypothetical protein
MAASGTALTIDMETFEKLNGFDELFDSGGHCTALRCAALAAALALRAGRRCAPIQTLLPHPATGCAAHGQCPDHRAVLAQPALECQAVCSYTGGTCEHEWHLG